MPELTDRTKELMESLKELNLDSDEIPDEVKSLDIDDSSDEAQKKAGRAYKALKDRLKLSLNVIAEQQNELNKQRGAPTPETRGVTETSSITPQQQADYYMGNLRTRAMQNLGVADPNSPMLVLEIQRLYAADVAALDQAKIAEKTYSKIVEDTLAEFPFLGDSDKEAVSEVLNGMSVVDRADKAKVRREIHTYLGANMSKFTDKNKSSGNGSGGSAAVAAAAAAVSATKSKGSGGVAPGMASPGGGSSGSPEVKPLSAEEIRFMHKLGLDSSKSEDIKVFRRAKEKSKYVGSHSSY